MKTKFFRSLGVGLALVALTSVPQVSAQQPAKTKVNISGVWLTPGRYPGHPQSQWSTEMLPFTPKGLEMFQANKPGKGPRQAPPAFGNDPIGGANPPGLLRAISYFRPWEFVQLPDKVIQLFEFGRIWRAIYTDGRPVPDDVPAGPYWYGYSVGHYDGDALVVNALALDERAWMDEWGTPMSAGAKIEERWQRTAPDKLQGKITGNDPITFTRAWTSSPIVYALQHGYDPQEIIFAPIDESAFNQKIRNPAGGAK